MSFVKGIVSGITSVGGGIVRGTKTGANFGKYVGKTTGASLTATRMRYLLDSGSFKVGNMSAAQVDDTIKIVSDNPKILDDLTEGTIEREEAIAQLSKKFSDAGIRSDKTGNRNLAKKVVKNSMDHTNKSKIFLNLTKEQVGGAAGSVIGGSAVLATAGVLIYGIASTISAMLGGAFDKLLDASAESDTGTFIMMGVVIIGSILAINFVRETIS
jgi:hypothetical protein